MIRHLCQEFSKQKKTFVDSNFAFLTMFQQFTTGVRLLRAYLHDYLIYKYVETAVIRRIYTASINQLISFELKLALYCLRTTNRRVCCVSLFLKYIYTHNIIRVVTYYNVPG